MGPYDLIIMLRIPDFERLAEIMPEKLGQILCVARTETMVAFRCYPNYDLGRIISGCRGSGSLSAGPLV
jgi:DNA-binding Lrp family transcriptional regulator